MPSPGNPRRIVATVHHTRSAISSAVNAAIMFNNIRSKCFGPFSQASLNHLNFIQIKFSLIQFFLNDFILKFRYFRNLFWTVITFIFSRDISGVTGFPLGSLQIS
jgi:hypothetical protein